MTGSSCVVSSDGLPSNAARVEESGRAADFLRAALALAAEAGGDSPLPVPPSVAGLEDVGGSGCE